MDFESDQITLQWHDYIIFAGMLVFSTIIGLYFGYYGRNTSKTEYLLGGKNMKIIPIGFSLTASIISGTAMIIIPADIYNHGTYSTIILLIIPLTLIFIYLAIIPIFYNLEMTSIYEYIGLRFNKHIQLVLSILFLLTMLIACPIYIYLPALSLAQGTGLNVHYIVLTVCIVCVFYTTIGGLKAVVWTDTLQFTLLILTFVLLTVISTVQIGGFWKIMETSYAGDRLNIDFDFDLTKRDTFWALFFGYGFFWLHNIAVNQACIQKSLALASMAHIKKSFVVFGISGIISYGLTVYMGHIIYAVFKDCDPLTSKKIKVFDQIVPYYILQTTRNTPGFAGLYIAGLFSGGISSLSSALNAFACTMYNDILKYFLPEEVLEGRSRVILNLTTLAAGILTTLSIFVIEKMGSVFSVIFTVIPLTSAPLLGIYILGMFSTTANSMGVIAGVIASFVILSGILYGRLYYTARGFFKNSGLPISTEGCNILNVTVNEPRNFNITTDHIKLENDEWKPFFIFGISEYYFIVVGVIIFLLVGWIVSWLTKDKNQAVNKDLISPIMHRFLPTVANLEYATVTTEIEN